MSHTVTENFSLVQPSTTQQVLSAASRTLDTLSALLGLQRSVLERRATLPVFTLQDVADHCSPDDCWLVVYDRVYDVTPFLHSHPGGYDLLMDFAGRDASSAFHGVGHSTDAIQSLQQYRIGSLPVHECLWT